MNVDKLKTKAESLRNKMNAKSDVEVRVYDAVSASKIEATRQDMMRIANDTFSL